MLQGLKHNELDWQNPDGIVAFGNDLSVETLLYAYQHGVFPWPIEDFPIIPWCSPLKRGVLDFSELKIPKSLKKAQAKSSLQFTIDKAFPVIVEACSRIPRPDQPGTWITGKLKKAYLDFHRAGFAHSVEAWEGEELAGGLYGVLVGKAFAGESMFHLQPNASKLALLFWIEHLQKLGHTWMDIQMVTPHFAALGAKEISRDEFLERLL